MKNFLQKISLSTLIALAALCMNSCSNEDLRQNQGTEKVFSGFVLDRNGDPVPNKTVILMSDFENVISTFQTDVNGYYQGSATIFNSRFILGLKNDGFPVVEHHNGTRDITYNFSQYVINYSIIPSNLEIELPPLVYSPISIIDVEIRNFRGGLVTVRRDFIDGFCMKTFNDGIESEESTCYEIKSLQFDFPDSFYSTAVVSNSTITFNINYENSQRTESFIVSQPYQKETITIN